MSTAPAAPVKRATPIPAHPKKATPKPKPKPKAPAPKPKAHPVVKPKRIQLPSRRRPFPSRRMSNRQWSGRNGRDDVPELLATAQHRHLAQPVVPVLEVLPVVPEVPLEVISMKKSRALPRQRVACDPLEDRDRGEVGAGQARAADDEGLFQHVLAAQASVAGAVGEDDPG